jgi:predicted RNase H-like nuclease (RuvC/YqgF family)
MQDMNFIQSFGEIAQDNFISVVKQNLLFQTQIKLLDEQAKKIPELLQKIDDLEKVKDEFQTIVEENTDLKNQITNKNNIIETTSKTDIERHRLQTALNNEMKLNSQNNDLIESLKTEITKQKELIEQLQTMIPQSKKKKLGLFVEEVETKKDNVLLINQNGGTF